eukprot:364709-Chlamydomonas_euryale.AAC.12
MLGGAVNEGAGGSAAAAAGPRLPSAPMAVSDFLDKGGGQLLPRKAQDRRDKEKDKRMKGQSAIGSWKSEAEMGPLGINYFSPGVRHGCMLHWRLCLELPCARQQSSRPGHAPAVRLRIRPS